MKKYMVTGCEDMSLKEVFLLGDWSDEQIDAIASLEVNESVTLKNKHIVRYQ